MVAQLRKGRGRIGVGRKDDALASDLTATGADTPACAITLQCAHRAIRVDLRARADGRTGQRARIGQGLDRARARVMQGGAKGAAAGARAGRGGIQQRDIRTARLPLRGTFFERGLSARIGGAMQGACGLRLARHGVARDQIPDQRRGLRECLQQSGAVVRPCAGDQVIGHQPQPGIDQPDIAPRSALTYCACLQHRRADPGLRQMQRRRQPRIAAADNPHLHLRRARKGRGGRCRRGCVRPEAGAVRCQT